MTARARKPVSLWGQGGVALADILANSVAVILILIVVTLSVQQENAQLELEKNADLTTILARQLSTSVVYNDLPSSPPARLHRYTNCRIPHDCKPSLYPIVELHQNYVREFNSDLSFFRDELLKEGNAFDQLLNTFSKKERQNIRIDVYDVNLYYLAIGVLKEHDIHARHWHFLGEHVRPPISTKDALAEGGYGSADDDSESLDPSVESEQNKDVGNGSGNTFSGQPLQDQQVLSETEFAGADMLEQLQRDSLLPPSENAGSASESQSQNSGQSGDSTVTPDEMFGAIIELLEEEGIVPGGEGDSEPNSSPSSGSGSQSQRRSMKMHIPDSKNFSDQGAPLEMTLSSENYYRVLLAFFIDQLQMARHQRTAFTEGASLILQRYALQPEIIANHPHIDLIERLEKQLKPYQDKKETSYAPFQFMPSDFDFRLILPTNHVNGTSTLYTDLTQGVWQDISSENQEKKISLVLRSFPGLYGGQRLDFPPAHLIIVHPDEFKHPDFQWRPIIVVDTWLENVAVGFIQTAIKDEQLMMNNLANEIQINQRVVPDPPIEYKQTSTVSNAIMYLVIGVVLFFLLGLGLLLNARNRGFS